MAQDGGKVVSLTHRPLLPPPLPPGNIPDTHLCLRLSRPQGHSAIGRIMSMKNSHGTIWTRASDIPICSTAPLPLCYCGPHRDNVPYLITKIVGLFYRVFQPHTHKTAQLNEMKWNLNRNESLKDTVPWSRITAGKLDAHPVKKVAALHGTRNFSDLQVYTACLGLSFFKVILYLFNSSSAPIS